MARTSTVTPEAVVGSKRNEVMQPLQCSFWPTAKEQAWNRPSATTGAVTLAGSEAAGSDEVAQNNWAVPGRLSLISTIARV